MTDDPHTQIPRSAKGKRPQYFHDPASDKLHFMIMALVEELSVTRDRLDAVERILDRKGVTSPAEIDGFEATDTDQQERSARRKAYVEKIMKCFSDEAAQVSRADPALDFDDVVKTISE